ncbi:MAG: metal-sensitive transcriptional regulator [Cetobacterium sp.]|uniref:metal-sensitive transcriptional regulator n=1 Tax=unclassified Cetobacterium TaxID=2630983 RepID=UPI00068EB702|nr:MULTISPECIES: metal-sensitive transcriptional regulator [unclassified Cetobacterium]
MSEECPNKLCGDKKKMIARANRIEGQIRGIKRMIEEDNYCDDVLNQISSAKAALDGIAKLILEDHLRKCVVSGIKNNDENKVIDELIYTLGKMMK